MSLLRLVGNLVLATLLIAIVALVLLAGFGLVVSPVWEEAGLADGVTEGNWTWIDEQPIYVQTWGPENGPPLVLVHDLDVSGMEPWRPVGADLGLRGLWVIAVDLKGLGHSVRDTQRTYSLREQATLLAKVLNPLQVQGATVLGHGWGAAVALQLAAEQPQFVGRLVLASPRVYGRSRPLWQRMARVPGLGRTLNWAMASGGPFWERAHLRRVYDPSTLRADDWARWRQPTRVLGTIDALLAMAASSPDSDLPDAIPGVGVPALILIGAEDVELSLDEAERLERELPSATLRVVSDAGYHLQVDQPTRTVRYIADFALSGR